MANCLECGIDNAPDANFCYRCGSPMTQRIERPQSPPESRVVGEEIEEAGKRLGEEMKKAGEEIGRVFHRAGKGVETWWDRTFGILGPLIVALIGFVVLVIIIVGIGIISNREVWNHIGDFLQKYAFLLLFVMLLGSYSDYFSRRHSQGYRWFGPVIAAIVTVIWIWIAVQILLILGSDLDVSGLRWLAGLLDLLMPVVFVLIIVIGYLVLFLQKELSLPSR